MAKIQVEWGALPHINSELEECSRVKTSVHPGFTVDMQKRLLSVLFHFHFHFRFHFRFCFK